MYVARSYNLHTLPVWKRIFLPVLYSTGLVDSSKKRKITSISVTLAVAVLVIISKRLSPLPRGVLDVGVVTGLGGGERKNREGEEEEGERGNLKRIIQGRNTVVFRPNVTLGGALRRC